MRATADGHHPAMVAFQKMASTTRYCGGHGQGRGPPHAAYRAYLEFVFFE